MRLHPGEVQATGWRVEELSVVVRRLRAAAPDVSGRPLLVAIDGRGGAGKSTLVDRLRTAVPGSGVVHTDDIAWNHACFDWGDLMVEGVLRPLPRGEAVAVRPAAWIAHHRRRRPRRRRPGGRRSAGWGRGGPRRGPGPAPPPRPPPAPGPGPASCGSRAPGSS